jgi:DNA-binding transcriptional LysR family regulator
MWLVGSGKDEFYPPQVSLQDIRRIPYVHFVNEFPDFDSKLAHQLKDLPAVFESSNVGTLKRVIESGLGIGFLPAHSVKKQIRGGRLNKISVTDFDYTFDFLYYRRDSGPAAEAAEIFFHALTGDQERS